MQASVVFAASEVDQTAVQSILTDLVTATTPSVDESVSLFPRDLDTTNNVVHMTVGYLMQNLQSDNTIDLSIVSLQIIMYDLVLEKSRSILNMYTYN